MAFATATAAPSAFFSFLDSFFLFISIVWHIYGQYHTPLDPRRLLEPRPENWRWRQTLSPARYHDHIRRTMVDWRQLGEVPDSEDDDGLDSQPTDIPDRLPDETPVETLSSIPAPVPAPAAAPDVAATSTKDIWDIPSSQDEAPGAPAALLRQPSPPRIQTKPTPEPFDSWSSPLSSPLSSPPLSPLVSSQELPPIEDLIALRTAPQDPTSSPPSSATPRPIPAPTSHILSQETDPFADPDDTETPSRPPPVPTPAQSQILGHDAEQIQEARRAAVQYERSLRTRKPEQMRPYFMEQTRFNNEWRQHGLRPMRIANQEHEERHRRRTSHERDFEPESQDSAGQQPTDESQQLDSNDLMEGLLFPESSSPVRNSPLNNRAGPSSQGRPHVDTDGTSLDGDDLPSLQDLINRHHSNPAPKSAAKRRHSPVKPTKDKRPRVSDPSNREGSPQRRPQFIVPPDSSDPFRDPEDTADIEPSHPPSRAPAAQHARNATPRAASTSLQHTAATIPAPLVVESESDQDTEMPGADGTDAGDVTDTGNSSDDGSDIVQQNGRRIRGVLPASWLRIDQMPGRSKVKEKMKRRRAEHSPERDHRRGVAQRRQVDPSTINDRILFEVSSDEEDQPNRLSLTTDDVFHNQSRLNLQPLSIPDDDGAMDDDMSMDDGMSVVEEDHIDAMISRPKRQTKLADAFRKASKQPKAPAKKPPMTQPRTQPKITGAFPSSTAPRPAARASTSTSTRKPAKKPRQRSGNTRNPRNPATHKPRPPAPQLSVLDVIEPDAPNFLKIAARTARGRRDQGRSKPGRKTIQMATRSDHVDAASVLMDWTNGSIKQRPSVTAAKSSSRAKTQSYQPLTERSANTSQQAPRNPKTPGATRKKSAPALGFRGTGPQKLQLNRNGNNVEKRKPRSRTSSAIGAMPQARPAQLEVDHEDEAEMNAASFHAGKRLLDRLYRSKNPTSTIASSVHSNGNSARATLPKPSSGLRRTASISTERSSAKKAESPRQGRRLARKKRPPQRVDIDEPQYSRANDPLPVEYTPSQLPPPVLTHAENEAVKLQGLGSYGTEYTHHFEMFPLIVGVYFHESTLLGSGMVERVLRVECNDAVDAGGDAVRPRATLTLGEQTMRWGPWSAQVSSEMGIVVDYLAEQLEKSHVPEPTPSTPSAVAAAHHILAYVQNSLTVDSPPQLKAFAGRFMEVVQSLNTRVLACMGQDGFSARGGFDALLGTYDRLVLATFRAAALCKKDPTMMGEQLQMEELLKAISTIAIKALSLMGLDSLRTTYGQLHNARFRERGLRTDAAGIHSWVLLLRTLESAAIPRSSFWDMVQLELAQPIIASSTNAQDHERLWKNMFTLLPLVEFNDMGVLVPGRRYQNKTDGWGIPQRLLKTIFQLYRDNPRQPPSFNNYCRALVARCHYLVQQWGWRRCSTIVGVIFDFFGSQNLAHLRNEEAYSSPRFLEELWRNPSLDVEPEDRCFHIFLKLVALSICKLKEDGLTKDIRNLVARTVPNHNRQHLKEQRIHERDLAALRNHHDLLCTLYWAAPPDLRPSVSLLERLVVPATSHKEACFINLRAWNQLARYIVASGQATTGFRPFSQWRNTFFQQMMQQFDSVAADIEQQFLGLSTDVTKTISHDMISAMVAMNKTAAMDVLQFSVSTALDVMKHTPDLETATFALSLLQLQRVFQHFSSVPPELDWSILRSALLTLDVFLTHVDKFKAEEESQQSESQILNSEQADDALLVLHQDLASTFFTMARRVLSRRSAKKFKEAASPLAMVSRAGALEQVIVLSARLGLRFSTAGVMRLSDMFKPGKHGIFADMPHLVGLEERRYLSLFVTTLLKHGFDEGDNSDLSEAGITLRELWMLSIVKPRQSLGFENQLAEQLARCGKKFVPDTVVGLATNLDYNMNRDLFEFAISSMRRSVRDAGPSLRRIVLAEDSKTLKLVMEQIKSDLKTLAEEDAVEHSSYVPFVRDIISLIRAHGSDICSVDDFFYQISKEYSPSVRDPQLQVAAMMSYGLRLSEEGDSSRAAHQLFFFLFNNFKLAMMNDKLGDEVGMLRRGLQNPGILHFVLGSMLPAAVRASHDEEAASFLVDVYAHSCWIVLDSDTLSPELSGDTLRHVVPLLEAVVDGLGERGRGDNLTDGGVHMVGQFLGLMNMMWPSIRALHLSGATPDGLDVIRRLLQTCRSFTFWLETYMGEAEGAFDLTAGVLVRGLARVQQQQQDGRATSRTVSPLVTSFKQNIVNDVRRNWIVSGHRLSIQAPGKPQGTQSSRGIERPLYNGEEVLEDVLQRAREWNRWWDQVFATPGTSGRRGMKAIGSVAAPLF